MKGQSTNCQYVYKYIDQDGTVVYVGITNNMINRVNQHKTDKLKYIVNPTIMYFPVKHRQDAEMLETYLINHYGTGKYFNVKKKDRGKVSFLGECENLPWLVFDGKTISNEPYVADKNIKKEVVEVEIVKEKEVVKYVDSHSSETEIINKFYQDEEEILSYLNDEMKGEIQIVNFLDGLLNGKCNAKKKVSNNCISTGLRLHKKRLDVIKRTIDYFEESPVIRDDSDLYNLMSEAASVFEEIKSHESSMSA